MNENFKNQGTEAINGDAIIANAMSAVEMETVVTSGLSIVELPLGNGQLSQSDFNNANTIYVIKHDFSFAGTTITMKENCVLEFRGGSFSNGKLVPVFTKIVGNGHIFKNDFSFGTSGTSANSGLLANTVLFAEWFGVYFKMKKRLFAMMVVLLLPALMVMAYDFEVDGIYYRILPEEKQKVAVTYKEHLSEGLSSTSYLTYLNDYNGVLSIPNQVTYNDTIYTVSRIDDYAFFSCEIVYYRSVIEKIEKQENEYSITSVILPTTIESVGKNSFAYTDIESIEIPANVRFDTSSILSINAPFYGCTKLKEVIIHDNVVMAPCAFYECGVETVILGNNVSFPKGEKFNSYPHIDPEILTCFTSPKLDIKFMDGVEVIADEAFSEWTNIHKIQLPVSLKKIGKKAFYKLENLSEIELPEGLEVIDEEAFSYADIQSLHIPQSVDSIGKSAFAECNSLSQVNIPSNISYLGEGAFMNCNISKIEIPECITEIPNNLFSGCKFKVFEIPDCITSIGHSVFQHCTQLEHIEFSKNLNNIGSGAFYGCTALKTLEIPENVGIIGYNAFGNCTALHTVSIPKETKIYSSAFEGCTRLQVVTIPDSLSSRTFYGCNSIKEIYINTTSANPIDDNNFTESVYDNAILYVPVGTAESFGKRRGWSNFYTIKEYDSGISVPTEVFLTIKDAAEGQVKLLLPQGCTQTLFIEPEEGWIVHSVTFNGNDVTGDLMDGNCFLVPTLYADATICITYESPNNIAEEVIHGKSVKVKVQENAIYIDGMKDGETVSVYNLNGITIASAIADNGQVVLELPTNDTYIVKTLTKTVKVRL